MAGKLTTHVLDTAQGCPAADMALELWQIESEGSIRKLLKTTRTNADGRTDTSLLEADDFVVGVYEIIFAVGDYFAGQAVKMTDPPFLDRVPIQFSIADPTSHYHVPLLASPWSYSTYRGS